MALSTLVACLLLPLPSLAALAAQRKDHGTNVLSWQIENDRGVVGWAREGADGACFLEPVPEAENRATIATG